VLALDRAAIETGDLEIHRRENLKILRLPN